MFHDLPTWLRAKVRRRASRPRLVMEVLEARDVPAAFTPGNLVVERIGDGTQTLGSGGNFVFLDEYTTTGTFVQTVSLPTAAAGGNNALLDSGTATSNGQLTRTVDGRYLVVPGTAGDAATANNSARVIGRVDGNAAIDTTTSSPNAATYNTNNFRSVASTDGQSFFTGGTATTATLAGTRYFATTGANATTTQLSTAPTNVRNVAVFGGQLFVTSGSSPFVGVARVWTGVSGSSGQTSTLITPATGQPGVLASPYAFVLLDRSAAVPGLDTLYVADSTQGVVKFSYDGTTWTQRGAVQAGALGGELTARLNADGSVALFFTNAQTVNNGLSTLTDAAAFNANLTGTATSIGALSTGGVGRVFRGVAWAPEAASPAPAVVSINRLTPAQQATSATTVTFRVTFNKAVFGVDPNDFALGPWAAPPPAPSAVSPPPAPTIPSSMSPSATSRGQATCGST